MVDSLGLGWSRRLCPRPRVPQPSGCVYSVQERFKQLLRSAVAELSAGPSVQLVSSGEDVLVGELLNGLALGEEGPKQAVVALVLGPLP